MCNNLEYLKSLNSQVRELAKTSKRTGEALNIQLSNKLNSHMSNIGEYINQYHMYMEDMCKSMGVNESKSITIINDNSYKGSAAYATDNLAFSFQNLKTTSGMRCRKMFKWYFHYCGSSYCVCAVINDTNNISFSGTFCVDDTIKAFKELLLVNKSLIMSVIDGWVEDAYRAVINKQVDNMSKVEAKLLRDCVIYGISE